MRKALSREDVCPIATSGVVAAMLREIGREPVATVQAGLLEGEFGVDAPIDGREKLVGFQRRSGADKDLSTALAVAELILAESPDVRLECYGRAKGKRLPKE